MRIYLRLLLGTFMLGMLMLILQNKVYALNKCCKDGYSFNVKFGKCVSSTPHGTVVQIPPLLCSEDERCQEGFCVSKSEDPPDDATCGYEGMSCCAGSSHMSVYCIDGSVCDMSSGQCVERKEANNLTRVGPSEFACTNVPGQCIDTALGEFPIEPQGLITWFFTWGISIGGGVAFIMMAIGAFLLITSTGVPEKIQQGKEFILSAFTGLLFIIFAVFLLNLIGVQIFQIPGFS